MSKHAAMLLVTGPLNESLAGPEIRALEFAKMLSQDREVTLLAQRSKPTVRDGMKVLPARRDVILAQAPRHDLIISPALPPYLLPLRKAFGFSAVADQYDPHDFELVTLTEESHDRELQSRAAVRALQLSQADLILCAGERQRRNLIDVASTIEFGGTPLRIDPVVIPFGISPAPAASGRRPLREHFPQIGPDDPIVLWWGSVWQWLDADTVIRAFARVLAARPDAKLVITAGKPPNRSNSRFEATAGAIQVAKEEGIYGSSALFLDEWIPYERRYDYLREATLGVTLHRSSMEAELAARSRYMDYLSVGLPCILGRGDEVAAEFEEAGYATLVDRPDPEMVASEILGLLNDPVRLDRQRRAGLRVAADREWSAVGERLRLAVESIEVPGRSRRAPSMAELARTVAYYGHKVADQLAAATPRKQSADAAVE